MKYLFVSALALLALNACNSASEPSVKDSENALLDTVYTVYCVGSLTKTDTNCTGMPQKCAVNSNRHIDKTDLKNIKVFCNGEWHPYRFDTTLAFPK